MLSLQRKFGNRVRELRKSKRQTQEYLAEKLNIDVRSLRKIEAGDSFPSVRTLENIVKQFDITVMELFNFEHLQPFDDLETEIFSMVASNPDKIRCIYKVVKAIVS